MRIGLIGNPNTGKTTVFNALTKSFEKVGNWHGVTVGEKKGILKAGKTEIEVIDLPGVYSLSPFSYEEKVSLDFIERGGYDFIVNIVESCNLERNLYLTMQLIEKGVKIFLLVNMIDELSKKGGALDVKSLSGSLGVPVLAIDARKKGDIALLNEKLIKSLENGVKPSKKAFDGIYPSINSVCSECFKPPVIKESFLDRIFLNKYLALPVFFMLMLGIFFLTFGSLGPGQMISNLLSLGLNALSVSISTWLVRIGCPEFIRRLISDGIFGGVGGVFAFLPQVALMFFLLSVLEETGYMSRLAFVTDGIFAKIGLNGRAAFSMMLGFGCTAVAVLSTRGLDNEKIRKKTILLLPFISCSARMPIYMIICSAFLFKGRVFIIAFLYLISLLFAFFTAYLLNRGRLKADAQSFIMEMPPYRLPGLVRLVKVLINYMKQFIIKIGTVVLCLMLIEWLLRSLSLDFRLLGADEIDKSILARLGGIFKYLFYPMGFRSWEIAVAALSGLVAKEAVAGTLSMLYPNGLSLAMSNVSAFSFMVFCLLYTPCVATIAAIKREAGGRTALFSSLYQIAVAFAASYLTYFIMSLITGIGYGYIFGTLFLILLAVFIIMTLKRGRCKSCAECKNEGICGRKRPKIE